MASRHDRERVDCTDHETGDPDTWSGGVVGFEPTSIFDISQTRGEPLPELDTEIDAGDVEDPRRFTRAPQDQRRRRRRRQRHRPN